MSNELIVGKFTLLATSQENYTSNLCKKRFIGFNWTNNNLVFILTTISAMFSLAPTLSARPKVCTIAIDAATIKISRNNSPKGKRAKKATSRKNRAEKLTQISQSPASPPCHRPSSRWHDRIAHKFRFLGGENSLLAASHLHE